MGEVLGEASATKKPALAGSGFGVRRGRGAVVGSALGQSGRELSAEPVGKGARNKKPRGAVLGCRGSATAGFGQGAPAASASRGSHSW